ncbi:MAG: conjugal transfer protein TraO [Bacteroides sp.]|uniref:conjugal transfer protein TraO n=1 Tax=Bacteroides sp. TaxID=29523 RepID=UPI002FC69317
MKTHTALLIICFALLPITMQAQRYLPGQVGIQATFGMVNGDYQLTDWQVGAGLSTYTKNGNRWVYGVSYLNSTYPYKNIKIPVNRISAETGYYLNFLSDRRKTFFLSAGVSAMGGYETVNWGSKSLSDGSVISNRDRFIYGGILSLELETYLSDRVVLLLNVREHITWGSDTGRFHNQVGIGLKYIL